MAGESDSVPASAVDVPQEVAEHFPEYGSDAGKRRKQRQAHKEEHERPSARGYPADAGTHPRDNHEDGNEYVGVSHGSERLPFGRQQAQYPDSARP